MKGAPLAVAYCRVSTKPQLKGDGLRRQKATCQEWCDENGYFLAAIFQECGSAFRSNSRAPLPIRDGAVEYAQRHNAVLVFEECSRFSRDYYIPECQWVSVWDGIMAVRGLELAA
jgi:DNA invertase Pin-like site-specific DNA recombinase